MGVIVRESRLVEIADAIRSMTGGTATMKLSEMPAAIRGITTESGGLGVTVIKSVTVPNDYLVSFTPDSKTTHIKITDQKGIVFYMPIGVTNGRPNHIYCQNSDGDMEIEFAQISPNYRLMGSSDISVYVKSIEEVAIA